MQRANQEILNDLRDQVGVPYQAPDQMLDIALNFDLLRNSDPSRRNALRDLGSDRQRVRTRYVWTPVQDQQIVAFAICHLASGRDLSTIEPYRQMSAASPLLRHVQDPRRIRARLQHLCHEDSRMELEAYCGYNLTNDQQHRAAIVNVAQTVRASCLDLRLVRLWNLENFVRRRTVSTRSRTNVAPPGRQLSLPSAAGNGPSTGGTNDNDDVQIVDLQLDGSGPSRKAIKRKRDPHQ